MGRYEKVKLMGFNTGYFSNLHKYTDELWIVGSWEITDPPLIMLGDPLILSAQLLSLSLPPKQSHSLNFNLEISETDV